MAIQAHPPGPPAHGILALPVDIFLLITQYLDLHEYYALCGTCKSLRQYKGEPSQWLELAQNMLNTRPLPIAPSDSLDRLSFLDIRQALNRAAELEANWCRPEGAQLHSAKCFNINGGPSVELLTILPTARHIITSKPDATLACWDLRTGDCIASWPFGPWDRVVQCRPVDKGSACMLIVQVTEAGGNVQFELLRLQFEIGSNESVSGRFSSQLKFTAPHHQIADMSLSEDVITILTVSDERTASVTFLNWRTRSFISGLTSIAIPDDWNLAAPLFTLLSPDAFNVILDDALHPTIHTFSNDLLFVNLPSALGVTVMLPAVPEREMKFEDNTDEFLHWEPHSSLAHRKWDTTLRGNTPHLARPLSDFRTFEREGKVVLAHSMLPLPFDASAPPQARTFFAPFEVLGVDGAPEMRPALVIAESKYALYIERVQGDSDARCVLRACAFPPDEMRARKEAPEWYSRQLVRTLHVPEALDLRLACDIALNEAYGVVVISLGDGRMWVLQY